MTKWEKVAAWIVAGAFLSVLFIGLCILTYAMARDLL